MGRNIEVCEKTSQKFFETFYLKLFCVDNDWVKKTINAIGFELLLVIGFLVYSCAVVYGANTPLYSFDEMWAYQFDQFDDVESVAVIDNNSGKVKKVLVELTKSIGNGEPVSYFNTHPAWQREILTFSPDGKKIGEKAYTTQADGNDIFLSPDGSVWFFSSNSNTGYIVNADGDKTDLNFTQSHAMGMIYFSPKGSFAFFLDDDGWALRNENGDLIQYDNSTPVDWVKFSDDEKYLALDIPSRKFGNQLVVKKTSGEELFRFPLSQEGIIGFAFAPDDSRFAFATQDQFYILNKYGNVVFQKSYRYCGVQRFITDDDVLVTSNGKVYLINENKGAIVFKESLGAKKMFMQKLFNNEIFVTHDQFNLQTHQYGGDMELMDNSGKTLIFQKLKFVPRGVFFKNYVMVICGYDGTNEMLKVIKIKNKY